MGLTYFPSLTHFIVFGEFCKGRSLGDCVLEDYAAVDCPCCRIAQTVGQARVIALRYQKDINFLIQLQAVRGKSRV
jgi:hypothetical protein